MTLKPPGSGPLDYDLADDIESLTAALRPVRRLPLARPTALEDTLMTGQNPNDSPNTKLYELRYDDGERFTRRRGGNAQREFTLDAAIHVADFEAARSGRLSVVDPETGTVLRVGTMVT